MVIFLVLTVVITGLQVLHLKLLRHVFPPSWHRPLPWILLLINLPLAVFMVLRLSGNADESLGHALRPFMRAGFYFLALTIMGLLWGWLSEGLWYVWRVHIPESRRPPFELSRRHFLQGASLAGLGTATVGSALGAREAYGDPVLSRQVLWVKDLHPGLDGLRLAFLSDLHAGPLIRPWQVQRWRELAEREEPELLLFGGDIVDSLPEEAVAVVEAFHAFPAPLGRFAVLGNHDYFMDPRPIWKNLEAAGIELLENAHVLLKRRNATLALMGLQDPMARNGRFQKIRFGPGPQPDQAARGIPPNLFRLCLAHRPSMWDEALAAGAHLTLSGHTHGGQINLLPGISSARILGPYTSGLYTRGEHKLYVSRGLGVVALPMRLNAKPELTLLTLRRA